MGNFVIIKNGAIDWQIFQHENGLGSITLDGNYVTTDNPNDRVWVRIVSEISQMAVVDWISAEINQDNYFIAYIKNIPIGGLYRIETCISPEITNIEWGGRGDSVFHIGIGDLYVITGQSNSAGYGRTPVHDPPELGVHLYRNNENWDLATHPMNDSTRSKHEINAENVNPGHSAYLSFAKKLKAHLNYPIGLIQTALGGSQLSRWNPAETGDLYSNMVDVVINCTNGNKKIAGILWNQGSSDCDEKHIKTYLERFKNMVISMRNEFSNENLPFYTVQLNKEIRISDEEADLYWSQIREIQRLAAGTIKDVYVIPTMDLGLSDFIHNNSSANLVIGERLANIALSQRFHKNVYGLAPDIESAKVIDKTQVRLVFSNVNQYISTMNLSAKDLQLDINDENGIIEIESYSVKGNIMDLYISREIGKKAKISFAAKKCPSSVIPFDIGSGLPLLGFFEFNIEY